MADQDQPGHEPVQRTPDTKFSIAFRASPTGMALSRISDGLFLEVNETYARMLGYDRTEIVGHSSIELDILSAEYRAGVRQHVTSQGFVRDLEMDLRAKSGEAISVLCSMEQVDWEGEPAFLTMVFDISARKRAEQALLRKNTELSALSQLGQALIRLVRPSELWEVINDVIGPLVGSRNLYIALYDEPSGLIEFPVYTADGARAAQPARPWANGLTEYVIQSRAALWLPREVASAAQSLGVELPGRPPRCYLGVPLLAGSSTLGVIGIQDYEHENVYDAGHLSILNIIASQAASALENSRLFAETERLARTDALTGIANRRQLFEAGHGELSRARRFGHPLTALMLDIDHFKQVNDTHGHAAGDRVLQSVARLCRQYVRDIDIVARYGGEEFTILLVETALEGGYMLAGRLCELVARTRIEIEQQSLAVTISLGVAGVGADGEEFASLLARADGALYAAKQAGRNRVVVA